MDAVCTIMSPVDGPPPRADHTPLRPGDAIRRAVEVMLGDLVDELLVADDAGRVVGMVTWSDVVAWAIAQQLSAPEP